MKQEIDVKLIEEVIISIRQGGFSENKLNMLEQALALPPQFYKGQQGMVSNDGVCWHKGILTDNTVNGFECKVSKYVINCLWKQFKPDPEAVTLPVWLPATGGRYSIDGLDTPTGAKLIYSADKTMYTVIPPYEVLS